MDSPIGIFDSGLGGLTVFKEIRRLLPEENLIYLGDTARVPYGSRSKETIARYAYEDANFLIHNNIKLLVIACNSAAAAGGELVRSRFDLPVVDVITPGVTAALQASRNRRIGIIGTSATINSGAYEENVRRLDQDVTVTSAACPLFVPLVEEGWIEHSVTKQIAAEYLSPLIEARIDTLILGCTHYPMLTEVLGQVVGKDVILVNSARELALAVKDALTTRQELNHQNGKAGLVKYYVTDIPQKFIEIGERFLGEKIEPVEQIRISVASRLLKGLLHSG